ncbi:MAG: MCP four helix bundle domain-containing protein, partial [Magnetococcales bacterium]|nr:MCP four helix bundle domain-containing protein [Magnetococcales bacterium]
MGIRNKVSIWAWISMIWVTILGGSGLYFTNHVAELSFSMVENKAVPMIEVNHIRGTAWKVYLSGILHAGLTDPMEMEKLGAKMDKQSAHLLEQLDNYSQVPGVSKEWLNSINGSWAEFREIIDNAISLSKIYAKEDAMQLLVLDGKEAFDNVLVKVAMEETRHREQMTILRDHAGNTSNKAIRWITVITILFGLMVLIGWFYARIVSQSLNNVTEHLTTSVTAISSTINQQERIASQQAISVNQTNVTMEELGTSARKSAEQTDVVA